MISDDELQAMRYRAKNHTPGMAELIFASHAREDVIKLIDEVERLRAALNKLPCQTVIDPFYGIEREHTLRESGCCVRCIALGITVSTWEFKAKSNREEK